MTQSSLLVACEPHELQDLRGREPQTRSERMSWMPTGLILTKGIDLHRLGKPSAEIYTLELLISVSMSVVVDGLGSRKTDRKLRANGQYKVFT
jgi:hypothetical protein